MLDAPRLQLTGQFQQFPAALFDPFVVGRDLQGEDQVLQGFAIVPLRIRFFRLDKAAQRRRVLA